MYTPPPYTAVIFNRVPGAYTPPLYTVVIFNAGTQTFVPWWFFNVMT